SRTDRHSLVPKSLFESRVPADAFLRLQWRQRLTRIRIEPEDFVLTARRTETFGDARVQRRVGFVDLVTARNAVRPHVAELIEMIDATAGDEKQVVDRH